MTVDHKYLEEKISDSLYHNCYTPDLPLMRYAGYQYVFLWDQTKFAGYLTKNLGLSFGKDLRMCSSSAVTNLSFLPLLNKGDTTKFHKSYLTFSKTWLGLVDGGLKGAVPKKALPLYGRVYKVNTKALTALDRYYCNSVDFRRVKVKVSADKDKEMEAWTYLCPPNSFLKYEPHKELYYQMAGMELSLVSTLKVNNTDVYGMKE